MIKLYISTHIILGNNSLFKYMFLLLSVFRILASFFWRILWDHKWQFLGLNMFLAVPMWSTAMLSSVLYGEVYLCDF